jgi:hypothetical protein
VLVRVLELELDLLVELELVPVLEQVLERVLVLVPVLERALRRVLVPLLELVVDHKPTESDRRDSFHSRYRQGCKSLNQLSAILLEYRVRDRKTYRHPQDKQEQRESLVLERVLALELVLTLVEACIAVRRQQDQTYRRHQRCSKRLLERGMMLESVSSIFREGWRGGVCTEGWEAGGCCRL